MAPREKIAVCRRAFFQLILQHLAEIPVSRLDNKSLKNDSVIFVINQVENVFHNFGFIGKMCLAIDAEAGILWISEISGFPTEKAPLLKKGDFCLIWRRLRRLSPTWVYFFNYFGKNNSNNSFIGFIILIDLNTRIADFGLDNAASFNFSFFVRKKAMIVKCTATFAGAADASGENGGCQDFTEFTNSIECLGNIQIVSFFVLDSLQFIVELAH